MSGFAHGITPVWGNYSPDKEFRYLRHVCYSRLDLNQPIRGSGHFCLTLHVAMQIGLYLPPLIGNEWGLAYSL